ncbi:MAG: acyl--CoA ligase [Lachnospiraceae bacterium]|nr:acyl--CoA ligase [Lachnospiraceae bacterium]
MEKLLIEMIVQHAEEQPDKTALASKSEVLTYAALVRRIKTVALRLAELGIAKGDKVLLSAPTRNETVIAYLATQYIGAVTVFIDKNMPLSNISYIYREVGSNLFISSTEPDGSEGMRHIQLLNLCEDGDAAEIAYSRPEDDALAEMLYTSGSTGRPKGVVHTNGSVTALLRNTAKGTGVTRDDVILLPLPLNHSFALRVMRAYFYSGGTIVLQNGFTFIKIMEDNIENFGVTGVIMVPATIEKLYRQMGDGFSKTLGRLRYVEVGAGALTVRQRKVFAKALGQTTLFNTWGSSETGGVFFFNVSEYVDDDEALSALGYPIENVEVRIDESLVPPEDALFEGLGRICLKGSMIMDCYWNQPDVTADALRGEWIVTGDLGYRDARGMIHMVGRSDDMINVGGEKVAPIEVENAAIGGIRECACVGVPDEEGILGEVPAFFYVPDSDEVNEQSLKRSFSENLERYKVPVLYIRMDALPRNAMGKIRRGDLKKHFREYRDGKITEKAFDSSFE